MIKNFENVCTARKNADKIEARCEEVLRAITHEPMSAKQIAERANIMRADYDWDSRSEKLVPNYQRVVNEMKFLIALGLVKKIIEEWDEEIEFPDHKRSVMVADKRNGDEVLSYHWEDVDVPACKVTIHRSHALYSLAD